jgi:hypothetical protein
LTARDRPLADDRTRDRRDPERTRIGRRTLDILVRTVRRGEVRPRVGGSREQARLGRAARERTDVINAPAADPAVLEHAREQRLLARLPARLVREREEAVCACGLGHLAI